MSPSRNADRRNTAQADTLATYLEVLRDFPDGDTVCHALTRGPLGRYGAYMSMLYSSRADYCTCDLVGSYGLGAHTTRVYTSIHNNMELPGAETCRTSSPQILTAERVVERYPLAGPFYRELEPTNDVAFLPLLHRGAASGFLVLVFNGTLERTWHAHATINAVCDATSLWVLLDRYAHGHQRAAHDPTVGLALTARQREIIVGLREGATLRAIGESLGYSRATIKADLTALNTLLGAKNRHELLALAARAGL